MMAQRRTEGEPPAEGTGLALQYLKPLYRRAELRFSPQTNLGWALQRITIQTMD
jgi:hypothetical protein